MFPAVTSLTGGLGLFLLGMHLISEGLQKAAAREVQQILAKVTSNRVYGMLTGIIVTILLQTSAVTTVLLVSLVNAGLMSLSQALGVILGAAIGSTFTAQLVALRLSDYSLWALVLGLLPYLFSKRFRWKHLGEALVGFGLIFYGAALMGEAAVPLRSSSGFISLINHLSAQPWLMVVISTMFTALIQASAATVVVAMALASQGGLTLPGALAMVLGANLGTTATALLCSLPLSRAAKRVALAHFIFKLGGVLIFLPFLPFYTCLVRITSLDVARQVANGHTLFNIINMLIFLPFTPWIGKLTERLLPDIKEEKLARYLDPSALEVPEIAFTNVMRELMRMAEIIKKEMFTRVMLPLAEREIEVLAKLKEVDSVLDYLYQAIAKYLVRIPEENLTEEQLILKIKLLYIANDLEHVGDVLVEMAHQWRKIETSGLEFSREGQIELQEMFQKVKDNFNAAIEAFVANDEIAAAQIVRRHPEILRLEKDLRCSHFKRLQQENRLSLETTSVHMELINQFLRLNFHNVSIAQAVMGII
ncbi:phosphate:Na+ symporter [Thermanaeromonas toyohensis ToBE]|uniref:Phosphate:Na+ symporter n=1 Tax=Thermanaeromonas toyohensis ToBE TaxID=698762 RepID=A0A1W1VX06_9FIRM|nr:Na/Pi cotransporter family protein [Thermanaeromonas toyohensis]SMB97424.1 phosphate:Na+ symporter [Thermanaeromonas toyohensis ToBE]